MHHHGKRLREDAFSLLNLGRWGPGGTEDSPNLATSAFPVGKMSTMLYTLPMLCARPTVKLG